MTKQPDDDFKLAKIEGELMSLKTSASHSTAKLIAICPIVAAVVGAPGFWQIIRPPPAPEPEVTKEEFNSFEKKIDRIDQNVQKLTVATESEKAKTDTRLNNVEKAIDRLTPPNYTKLPKQ